MFDFTLYIDETEIKQRLGALSDQSGKVIARAANRAYVTGKKAIAKEARKDYRVTQKDVNNKKTLKVIKATALNPTAMLDYTGKHRNLYLWDNGNAVSPKTIIKWSHGKPNVRNYAAAVTRGHPRIKWSGHNKPFVQRVRKGEKSEFVGLFRRKNRERDSKLVAVSAPSMPQILKNDKIMEKFQQSAGPMLQQRLEHEIDFILKGGRVT